MQRLLCFANVAIALVAVGCDHPAPAPAPCAPTSTAIENTTAPAPTPTPAPAPPIAGMQWSEHGRGSTVAAVEDEIAGAPVIAIVKVTERGNRCIDSISESLAGDVVEVARSRLRPATAGADDFSNLFGGWGDFDGYLVASLDPTPFELSLGNACSGQDHLRTVASKITAYVALPDLASARAEAGALAAR